MTVTGVLGSFVAATSAQCMYTPLPSRGAETVDRGPTAIDPKDLVADADNVTGRDDVSHGIPLRVLPLGASITAGWGSSDGNGYRKYLQQDLAGTEMQYVGSLRSGAMTENHHEGHSGFTIT